MSSNWGGLQADPGFRFAGRNDECTGPTRDPEAGAWPENLEISAYADSSMSIPGKGEPGKNCGEWYPQEFCDECGEPRLDVSRCEQRTCPRCWGAWARRRSEKIARRLGAARFVEDAADDGKRAVHAVVSPPEGEIRTLSDVSQGYRDAYGLAVEKGVRGGVVVFHGYRATDEAKLLFDVAKSLGKWSEDEDGKLWSFIRRKETRDERGIGGGTWREMTYWSPHWHVLGLCRDFEADDPDSQDGWVARRIRSLEPFKLNDLDGYGDMVGAAMYLLSHAVFETDSSKDCVRWFGQLATTKFQPDKELDEDTLETIEENARKAAESGEERGDTSPEPEECEKCGSTSFSPIWDAGYALQDRGWCERIGREQQNRLLAAFEWAIGERLPPAGAKHPKTEADAQEALELLL